MGLDLDVTISALTVFVQGILSFFSPCVLPIIPLYIGYLSGGASKDEQGNLKFNQKKVLMNTLFFIVGISFAFFILGLGFSSFSRFITQNQIWFSRIGGAIIILFGLIQMGIISLPNKGREYKLPIKINVHSMSPFVALLMGFTFSFAWTPCVGPALSTVLILVANTQTMGQGILLMLVYTIGFTLPFLIVGVFTTQSLRFFKHNQKVVRYTVKIGAVIMIVIGLLMVSGTMNQVSQYFASLGINTPSEQQTEEVTSKEERAEVEDAQTQADITNNVVPAIGFSLYDQFGNLHTLEQYKGKVIFFNFWATWCPPCQAEMPYIQTVYEQYGGNEQDVIILGVASPNDENPMTREGSSDEVITYMQEHGYTYPTLLDPTGSIAAQYGVSSYPTTFMIDKNGYIYGYIPGGLPLEIMQQMIEQTLAAK